VGRDERYGRSVAILVGDLAAVWAETLLREAGFAPQLTSAAFERFDRMRLAMAAGQWLDVAGEGGGGTRVAALKTGSYTAEGPLRIGAALAGAPLGVEEALAGFGRRLGEAFQLRDDVLDGDAPSAASSRVNALLSDASRSLEGRALGPEAVAALRSIADLLRLPVPGRASGRAPGVEA